jgi:Flp pilus assembly protein TadG
MRACRKGSSIVEFAFIIPWFLFLFCGVIDLGFFNYALVTAQSAARTAALYTSSNTSTVADAATACTYVLDQMTSNINLSSATTCNGTSPITLTATSTTGPDGNPSSTVRVSFTSVLLIPIPGILSATTPIGRTVQMYVGR